MKTMKDIVKQKLESSETCAGDFLDQTIKDMKTEKFLSEDFIVNVIFGLLFASPESISSITTVIFKFLFDHPTVLEELRVILPSKNQFRYLFSLLY